MLHESFRTTLKPLSLLFALAVLFACCAWAGAQTGQVIYRFKGDTATLHDGDGPAAPLMLGNDGAFYGTTFSGGTADVCPDGQGDSFTCGTAFQLKPPAGKGLPWRERVIYSFGSRLLDGLLPENGALITDAVGDLYGTTSSGGLDITNCSANSLPYWCGTVFQLVPPKGDGAPWTENLIYQFQTNSASDGFWPLEGLTLDKKGNLYGTTISDGYIGDGTVFELSPPAASGEPWNETIIYYFQWPLMSDGLGPQSKLLLDDDGNLFGTTREGGSATCVCGTVFELGPPKENGQNWTESVLYSFQGESDGSWPNSLIRGADGSLYGTTRGDHSESCIDRQGGGYCGTVFKLSPPSAPGGFWSETVLHNFAGGSDGAEPWGSLVSDPEGRLYGTTAFGGNGYGTVFALAPQGSSWVEKVMYSFRDKADGANPVAGLILENGNLFGTASTGGLPCANEDPLGDLPCGTVFKITK